MRLLVDEAVRAPKDGGRVLNFATAFLKYITKTRFDTRYQWFELFLEMSNGLKVRKRVTNRIITKRDIENLLRAIKTVIKGVR